jgi:hypothetical protein
MGTPDIRSERTSVAPFARLITVRGSGLLCDDCHQPIERTHMEWRYDRGDRASPLRLHQWCYYARLGGD